MTRTRLPNRRQSEVRTIVHRTMAGGAQKLEVAVGFDAAGAPREVFLSGYREGSDMAHLAQDLAVVISIALQHGIAPEDLGHSLGEVPVTIDDRQVIVPASIAGSLIAVIAAARPPGWPEPGEAA